MKIELQEPFKSLWRKGYLRKSNQDGRHRVDLFNSNQNRTTISYARYLKSVELGYILEKDVEVDHKNTNCSDDSLNNLQILTTDEHKKKTKEERLGRNTIDLTCAYCGTIFKREIYNDNTKRGNKNSFCSRHCNGKYQRREQIKTQLCRQPQVHQRFPCTL